LNYEEIVNLDAEDLAEQGILSAYRELPPRLRQYLASPPIEVSEEIDDGLARYIVHAGAQRYVIWEDGAHNEDGWERATVAFFEIVNANLERSPFKFYALYGGNDLSGMFLTEEQCAAARRALEKRSDWPWLPVNEPPHYGYPNAMTGRGHRYQKHRGTWVTHCGASISHSDALTDCQPRSR
jgi:hypothetical protein